MNKRKIDFTAAPKSDCEKRAPPEARNDAAVWYEVDNEKDDLLSVDEIAAVIGVSRKTAYKIAAKINALLSDGGKSLPPGKTKRDEFFKRLYKYQKE